MKKFNFSFKNISNSKLTINISTDENINYELIDIKGFDFSESYQKNVVVYYPYLDLERNRLIQPIDHELYLKTLSLIAHKILLPPSHLIEADLKTIMMFKNYLSDFFRNGIFTTTYLSEHSSIKDFIISKNQEGARKINEKDKIIADTVIKLFGNNKPLLKRKVKKQSYLFYEFLHQGFYGDNHYSFANNNLFSSNDLSIIRKGVDTLLDKKGYVISKTDLDKLIYNYRNLNILDNSQADYMLNFGNNAYYYSGGIINQTIVSFSPYFLKVPFQEFLNDRGFGTNLFYNPILFLNTLKGLKIINDFDEIKQLSCFEIIKLRENSNFQQFIKEFRNFSYICYRSFNKNTLQNKVVEDILLSKFSLELKLLNSARKTVFELSKNLISIFLFEHPLNLLMLYPIFFNIGDYDKVVSRSIGFEKIYLKVMSHIKPFGAFCLTLEKMIKNNEIIKYT